jgi:hypothetical protein
VPIRNPVVKKLLLSYRPGNDVTEIMKQIKFDLVGIFSNCSLFELLFLVAHYNNSPTDMIFKTREGFLPSSDRATLRLTTHDVKELLRPSLWSVFHEFFGAECGISNYGATVGVAPAAAAVDVDRIITLLSNTAGITYLSPDDIVNMKKPVSASGPASASASASNPPHPRLKPVILLKGYTPRNTTSERDAGARSALSKKVLSKKKKGGSRKKRNRTYKKMNRRSVATIRKTRIRHTRRKL